MQMFEENYLNELNQFEEFWKEKMQEHQDKCKKEEEDLLTNHHNEITNAQKILEEYYNKKIMKHTAEYLNLKKQESVMKKQERFLEAHQIKEQCIAMNKKETEEFYKKNNEAMKVKMLQLIKKCNQEMEVFRQKFQTEANMLNKEKEKIFEVLIQKYKNKKTDLNMKQSNEKYLNENTQINKYCNRA
jgi:hypothetical protein